MIGKIIKGKSFRGALNYLFHVNRNSADKQSIIVASNMAGRTPRELSQEFGSLRRLRSTLNKAVSHISLSLSPNDRAHSNEELGAIAEEFLTELGYTDCPFVAIRHHDTQHPHIHLLVSRIDTRGNVISDKNDFKRAENIIRKLEKKHGLKEVLPSSHAPKPRRTRRFKSNEKELTMSNLIKNLISAISAIRNASQTMDEWVEKCIANGIGIRPYLNEDGKVMGLMYRDPQGGWHKASSLGKEFQWNQMAEHFGVATDRISPSLLGKISKQKNISDNRIANPNPTHKEETDPRRMVMDGSYYDTVWNWFKPEIEALDVGDGALILHFPNNGKILDEGDKATARGMSDKEAAKTLVSLAKFKGWESIQFDGNDDFVRAAMEEALRNGLNVVPLDGAQRIVLQEVKLKISRGSASLSLEPTATPSIKNEVVDDDETDPSIDKDDAKQKLLGSRALSSGKFKGPSPSRKNKKSDRPE